MKEDILETSAYRLKIVLDKKIGYRESRKMPLPIDRMTGKLVIILIKWEIQIEELGWKMKVMKAYWK